MTLILIAKVTVLLAVVAFGVWALRRSSAAARHLVGMVGLVAAMVLPVLAVVVPSWDVPLPALQPAESNKSIPAIAPPTEPIPAEPNPEPYPEPIPADLLAAGQRSTAENNLGASHMETGKTGEPGSADSAAWLGTALQKIRSVPRPVWGAIWFAGLAFVLGRLILGWMRMTQVAIDARPLDSDSTWALLEDCRETLDLDSTPSVLVTPKLRVPVLWGFVKPVLLLPAEAAQWPTDRLRVVLLHELSHMKRRDGLSLLLGRVTAALWWFHPMVWFLERRVRRDCETACDDMVLSTGERPSNYATHLLAIAGDLPMTKPAPVGALSILGRGDLERRIQSILRGGSRRGLGRVPALAMTAVCSLALLGIAGAQFTSEAAINPASQEERLMPSIGFMAAGSAMTPESTTEQAASVQYADKKSAGKTQKVMLAHDSEESREGARVYKKAYAYHNDEDWNQALTHFQEAAALGYRVGTSSYNAACGYARLGDARSAVDWLERALEADFDMRSLLRSDGDLDPIRRDPIFTDFIASLDDRGILRGGDRRMEKIQDAHDRLAQSNSTDGDRWYSIGSDLLAMRDFDKAIPALERAAELKPNSNGNAYYNLACAYSLDGNESSALQYLEKAVLSGFDSEERFENDSDLDNIRGTARFAEIDSLRESLSLDRFQSNWTDWGNNNYSERRWAPAVEDFQSFVQRSPNVGRAWSNLGWALHHSYRHAEAREAFQRQLDLGYKPGIATYNIGCTYAMEGDQDEAMNWLEKAVEMNFGSAHQILGDDDLKSLRKHPRFKPLLESAGGLDGMDGWEGWSLDKMLDHMRNGIRNHFRSDDHDSHDQDSHDHGEDHDDHVADMDRDGTVY